MLGESSDEEADSAVSWVKKSRKVAQEKAMAEKRVSPEVISSCFLVIFESHNEEGGGGNPMSNGGLGSF